MRRLAVKQVLLALIVVGVAFRVTSLVNRDVGFDANYYLAMGQSFAKRGEFYMPWGDPSNLNGIPSFSHHMSPLLPAYLGAFFAVFGSSYVVAKIAVLLVSLLVIVVVYWCTKDLYGGGKALVAAAIFALDYELIVETGKLYSENMTFLFFTLTMWAIIKGLKDDRFIVLAGLFAGLSYLSRSSLGYFFIIAGVGGFLWRFYYMRWGVFRNKWYMLAIVVFLAFVGGWGVRNLYHFGWPNWETSAALQNTIVYAFSQPLVYAELIVLLVPFFFLILLTYGGFWLPEMRGSIREIKDEQVSGLWLAVFLVPFIALFVSGALSIEETRQGVPLFWRDRVRYIFYAFLPIVWLAVRKVDFNVGQPLRESLQGLRTSLAAIRARVGEILRNRLWLFSILFLLASAIASLFVVGGWLAGFLFAAAPATFLRSPRKRLAVFLAVLLVFSVEAGTAEVKFAAPAAGMDLNAMLRPGEVVAVNGTTYHQLYFLYPFISDPEDRIVPYQGHETATYIVYYVTNGTWGNIAGYHHLRNYYDESQAGWVGEAFARLVHATTLVRHLSIVLYKHD